MSCEVHSDGTVFGTGTARVLDVAGHRILPKGTDNFMYAASQCVYVDKSLLVRDVVDQGFAPTLFCRPRRFGKSLAMGMLRAFFEAPAPGDDPAEGAARRALFERMLIWDEGERYRTEQSGSARGTETRRPVASGSTGSLARRSRRSARGARTRTMLAPRAAVCAGASPCPASTLPSPASACRASEVGHVVDTFAIGVRLHTNCSDVVRRRPCRRQAF